MAAGAASDRVFEVVFVGDRGAVTVLPYLPISSAARAMCLVACTAFTFAS